MTKKLTQALLLSVIAIMTACSNETENVETHYEASKPLEVVSLKDFMKLPSTRYV